MKRAALGTALLLLATSLRAEESAMVRIRARLLSTSHEITWSNDQMTVFRLQHPIVIRIQTENLLIVSRLLPIEKVDGFYVVLVRTEVWVLDPVAGNMRYFVSVRTLPLDTSETLLFYPLGVSEEDEQPCLELELTLIEPGRAIP